MKRSKIREKIGMKFFTQNTEDEEFSYPKAFKNVGKKIKEFQRDDDEENHERIDIRFENEQLVILVETKDLFKNWDKREIQKQLQEYVRYEKEYTNKKIVAILAETEGNDVWVWHGQSVIIDDTHKSETERVIKTFEEYEELCFGKVNDKIKIVDAIKGLNEILHSNHIIEKLRSQFVGTCLLALKNGLVYKEVKETLDENGNTISPEKVIIKNILKILGGLLSKSILNSEEFTKKAEKIGVLNSKILEDEHIKKLTYAELKIILEYIEKNIVPYINDKNTAGQDLLSLFFTTFNKYVGKSDKNQAFTPDHICDFMSKAIGVNKNSRILDPCCGSGAFLVRAMTDAMDDSDTEEEREKIKRNQIFGIEYEENAFGLASTNMLIHGDGNSNVIQASMFDKASWIKEKNINIVLMNPPYNATKKTSNPEYAKKWSEKQKQDPSKGLHFVEWVAKQLPSTCKIAVLLPVQTAIGTTGDILAYKKELLNNYTLEAVFSLPDEVFYPGTSSVACCMIFDLAQKHTRANKETFFGYFKNDNFIKRKGLGRVEKTDTNGRSLWLDTKELWLNLYKNKKEVAGLSIMKKINAEDEWLAEAYIKTDYFTLKDYNFEKTIRDYYSYLIKDGGFIKND